MRPFLAALVTTVLPALVGGRFVNGGGVERYALGGMVGIAVAAWGAVVGALFGALLPGAALAMVAGWLVGPRLRQSVGTRSVPRSPRIMWALYVVVGAFALCLLLVSFWRPLVDWDAWAIWGLKAKALAVSGSFSSPVFLSEHYAYSHPGYPPLLPAWHALAYAVSGELSVSWPLQFQVAFLWTLGATTITSLAARWGWPSALFLLAWVASPSVLGQIMTGYADVPMALFLVAGAAALYGTEGQPSRTGAVLLAAAALTKEEGLVFAVVVLALLLGSAPRRRSALVGLATVVVAVAPWMAFRRWHGIGSEYVSGENLGQDLPVLLVERLPLVLQSMGSELAGIQWGFLLPAALLLVLVTRRVHPLLALSFLGALGAVVATYLVTPYDLAWQLDRSMSRVVTGPLALLALFAAKTCHLLLQPTEEPARAVRAEEPLSDMDLA